jgi:hypothetical protein
VSTGGVTRDFTALASDATITIPAGQLTAPITLAINDDVVDEPDLQYIRLRTTGPTVSGVVAGAPATADLAIEDNDAAPTVSIGNAPAVAEAGTAQFPVKLSNLSEKKLEVKFNSSAGVDTTTSRGAASPGDYNVVTDATVTFLPFQQTVYQPVVTLADTALEGTETFTGTLSAVTSPSSGAVAADLGTPLTATGTINDDDPLPKVRLTDLDMSTTPTPVDVFYDEGTTATSDKLIEAKITLLNDSSPTRQAPLKLDYSFKDGTATNGTDYKGTAGTITIPASDTGTLVDADNSLDGDDDLLVDDRVWTVNIPVTILNDTVYEGTDESFSLVLSSSNATIDKTSAPIATPQVVKIKEGADDKKATWTTSDVAVTEGNEGVTTAKVTLGLSAAVGTDTVFTPVFNRTPGSATETGVNTGATLGDNDYDLPTAKTVTIKAGQTSAVVEVPINGDAVYERDEALVVDFDVAGTSVDTELTADVQHSARVTITGDDAKPTVKITEIAGAEGTTVRVLGTLVGVSQYPYSLGLSAAGTGDNPATAGTDFEVPATLATTTIPITRGQTALADSKLAEFYLLPDDVDEATETFGVTVAEKTAAPQGFTSATGNFRITDDPADLPPAASIRDESIGEWEKSVDVHVDFALDENTKSTTQTVTIPWWTANGSAKAGEDYKETKGVITLKPGDLSATVNVEVLNDKMKEAEENFYVKLGTAAPAGAAVTRGTGEVVIKSEDKADPVTPTLSVDGPNRGVGLAHFKGTAAPNTTVELYGAPLPETDPKEFKYLGEANADDDGYFEMMPKSLNSGWAFVARSQEINSAVKTVELTQLPSFSASSPKKGKLSVSVAGNPRAADQAVMVQRFTGGKWVTVGKGTTTESGWKGTFSFKSKTKLTLRAQVAGDSSMGINPGYSSQKKVVIK